MFKKAGIALCLGVLAAPAWSQTEAPPAASESASEKILIVGQRPGPGLWKVSKGDHVLWVFGTYAPLPVKMEWRSQQVEAILAKSQVFLAPPSAGTTIGVLRGITLLPHAIGFTKNPDGARLQELIPADVYSRWLVLKAKYLGANDAVERDRPFYAADKLYRAALQKAGLTTSDEVSKSIEKMVKKNNIKTIRSHVELEMEDPAKAIKQFKSGSMDDAACFAKTLERIETDIDAMRVRANAWSKGDLDVIRTLSYADRDAACKDAMNSSAAVKSYVGEQSPEQRMRKLWLEAAEYALKENATSFAMLRLKNILEGNDLLAALQARGYKVEAPE